MELDARAVRVARRQLGLLTRAQAIGLGCTPAQIRTNLARRRWAQTRRGLYLIGGAPPTWEQTLLAVVLPFDGCWISDGTGAKLWDLPAAPQIGGIEVLRPYGKHRRIAGVLDHRSRVILPADVSRHRKVPVTSIARTIVDCSGRLTVAQTGAMLDSARRRAPRSLEDIRACFARLAHSGHRRLDSIRECLAKRLPRYDPGESDLELHTLHALAAAGLPIPVQQLRMTLGGRRRRIDLAYPREKVAIELLGWTYHGGRDEWDADHARGNEVTSIGWRYLAFTSAMSADDIVRWTTDALALAAAA